MKGARKENQLTRANMSTTFVAEKKSFLAFYHAASLIEFWCFIVRRLLLEQHFSRPMNDK
jgi:hypothetical protein